VIHQGLDEGGLIDIEKGVAGRLRSSGWCCGCQGLGRNGLGLRDFGSRDGGGPTRRGGAAGDGAFEKVARSNSCFFMIASLPPWMRTGGRCFGCEHAALDQPGKAGLDRPIQPDGLCAARE